MTARPEPDQSATDGWCDFHKGPSGTSVLVTVVGEDSGPAACLYACAPCREQRGLCPLGPSSLPLLEGRQ